MSDVLTDSPGALPRSPVSRLILLADASARSSRIAERLLRASDYDVLVCADGESAFEKAYACRPAALVLDPGLRGVSGLQVLARLKRRPEPVPVVLTTRDENLRRDFAVATYPGLVFLRKPYDRLELVTALRQCIGTDRKPASAIRPDYDFIRATAQGPTVGVLRTSVLDVGVCARGSFRDTFFRLLPIGGRRAGLFVAEREAGSAPTDRVFRDLDRAMDRAVADGAAPGEVLGRADRCIRDASNGDLFSALALEFDVDRRELILGRAGYQNPLAATPGGSPAEILLPFGSLLGPSEEGVAEREHRTVRMPFPEDGALLLRSTGAVLSVGQSIPELGHRLFSGYLREHAGSPLPSALQALLGLMGALGVQGPGQDLLLMIVRRRLDG